MTERNSNHIIPSYCHLPVSCRRLVDRYGSLGSCKPQICFLITFYSRYSSCSPFPDQLSNSGTYEYLQLSVYFFNFDFICTKFINDLVLIFSSFQNLFASTISCILYVVDYIYIYIYIYIYNIIKYYFVRKVSDLFCENLADSNYACLHDAAFEPSYACVNFIPPVNSFS